MFADGCHHRRRSALSLLMGGRVHPLWNPGLYGHRPLVSDGCQRRVVYPPLPPAGYSLTSIGPFGMGSTMSYSPWGGAMLLSGGLGAYAPYGYGYAMPQVPWYTRLAASLLGGW